MYTARISDKASLAVSIKIFSFVVQISEPGNYGVREMNAADVLRIDGGMDGNELSEFRITRKVREKSLKRALTPFDMPSCFLKSTNHDS